MDSTKLLFILVLLVSLVQCTSQKPDIPKHIKGTKNLKVYSADAEPAASIKLTQEATFKAPEKYSLEWYDETASLYNWLASLEIDSTGRIYMADNNATKIHIFAADGAYIKSIGGKGRGPGEYLGFTDTQMIGNKLYVFDFMGFRTTRYSLDSMEVMEAGTVRPPVNQEDFKAIRTWRRSLPLLRSDGSYLAAFMEHPPDSRVNSPSYNMDKDRPTKYYLMNKNSKIISEEIFETHKDYVRLTTKVDGQLESSFRPLPFLERSIIKISDSNHIYTTWTDDFLIKVYGPEGNYKHAIYYPMPRKLIQRDEILSIVGKDDYEREVIENAELPPKWPVIRSMVIDDQDRLWISTIIEADGAHQWWVLAPDGKLIAKFRWPDNRIIKAVKDGYAYALETNQETGQQKVVKYKVEMDKQ